MSLRYFGIKLQPKFGYRSKIESYQDVLFASRYFDEGVPNIRLIGLCSLHPNELSNYLDYGEKIGHFEDGIIQKNGIECNQTWNLIKKNYKINEFISSAFVIDLNNPVITGSEELLSNLFKYGKKTRLSTYEKSQKEYIQHQFSRLMYLLDILLFLLRHKKEAPFVYSKIPKKIPTGNWHTYKELIIKGLENDLIQSTKKNGEARKLSIIDKGVELIIIIEHFISKYHMEPYFSYFIRK